MSVTPIQSRPPTRPPRALPHNVDAEASILGGLLLDPATIAHVEDLEVGDFYDPKHRIVFEAIRNLGAAGRSVDVVTVENEVEKVGKLDAIGGVAFLGELVLRVPTADNVIAYRDIVAQHARNRRAILELSSALERAYGWPHDPADLVSEVVGQLTRFEQERAPVAAEKRARWITPIETFLGDAEPDDDDAQDWIVRDLVPRAEPVLWGGPMKGGKTWAALDMAIAIARGEPWCGFDNTLGPTRALGLFLEDSQRRIRGRLWELCRGRCDPSLGFLTPNDPLVRENLRISRAPIRVPDAKDQRRFIAEIKAWGARFVVIDNLTRVLVGDPNSTRDASAFTRAWCEICEETGAAVMFLHHTRKAMGGDSKELDPFDTLRGSGDFGAAARNIIVVSPIRQDNGPVLAEIRMRGNLDLRRDGFVLGFDRAEQLGKWRTKLVDKGDIGAVKHDVRQQHRERRAEEKKADFTREIEQRKGIAMSIARVEGSISQTRLSRPTRKSTRSIDLRYYEGIAPGDIVLVSDTFMRDPATGTRGVTARAGIVTRHRYNPGGPNAADPTAKPTAMSGEIDVFFLDLHRWTSYAPAAEVDSSVPAPGGAGYDNTYGAWALYLKGHAYSETTEATDTSRFAVGDRVIVHEIDPAEVATPGLSWQANVIAVFGASIQIDRALTGWGASKSYRVIYDRWSQVVPSQQGKAFQASVASGKIEAVAQPFQLTATTEPNAFTPNGAFDLGEFVPAISYGDGRALDVGNERALLRTVNALLDYKSAHQSPMLQTIGALNSYASAGQWDLKILTPIFLGMDSVPVGVSRFLNVAPLLTSFGAGTLQARITLSRSRPQTPAGTAPQSTLFSFPQIVNVTGIYDRVTFSVAFSGVATVIPPAQQLGCFVKNVDGWAWLWLELGPSVTTRGIATCYEGPRVIG